MAYKKGNRNQMTMFPPAIDNYIEQNDPVRAYDAFIEMLDLEKIGIEINENKIGSSNYHPKVMLKLLIYGYSYGWRSSRKLERAIHHNLSFIWLMEGLKPSYRTISRFRKDNKEALKKVMKKSVKLCIELDLIEGNTLFLDGSKIRGNASINQTKTKSKLKKRLKKIDKRIEEILEECEQIDELENKSYVEMSEELKDQKKLQSKIKNAIQKMEKEEKEKMNLTDNECVNMKSRQGSHAGYNAQIVVDEKNGLIVSNDVVNENNDVNQFSKQIEQANKTLGRKCKTACADAGYSKASNLEKTVDKEIEVIVPNRKQAQHKAKKENPFSKENFSYDKEKDCYICPEGKELKYTWYDRTNERYCYRIKDADDCKNCRNYNKCTSSKKGRTIKRLKAEETRQLLAKLYETERGQEIYAKRKEKVELPFGHIKSNLKGGSFLLRGLEGVKAEMSINSTCFNLVRTINLLGGVRSFIDKITSLRWKIA